MRCGLLFHRLLFVSLGLTRFRRRWSLPLVRRRSPLSRRLRCLGLRLRFRGLGRRLRSSAGRRGWCHSRRWLLPWTPGERQGSKTHQKCRFGSKWLHVLLTEFSEAARGGFFPGGLSSSRKHTQKSVP